MLSDLILQAVLIVLVSIFVVMIYVARNKQRSRGETWFVLIAGSAFALLGVALVILGVLGTGRGYHGSPVPGVVIWLVGLLLTGVSAILSSKARGSLRM